MRKETLIIIGILFIGLVSASSISPKTINLNVSVGEGIELPFTLNLDKNSRVLISSDNPRCLIENRLFNLSKGTNKIYLTIIHPFSYPPSTYDCEIDFELIDIDTIVYVENKTTTIQHHTSYVQNQTNITIENPINNEIIKKNNYLWIGLIFLIILIISYIIHRIILYKSNSEEYFLDEVEFEEPENNQIVSKY